MITACATIKLDYIQQHQEDAWWSQSLGEWYPKCHKGVCSQLTNRWLPHEMIYLVVMCVYTVSQ